MWQEDELGDPGSFADELDEADDLLDYADELMTNEAQTETKQAPKAKPGHVVNFRQMVNQKRGIDQRQRAYLKAKGAVEEAKDSEIYESVRQLTQRSKPAPKDGASSSGGGGSSSFVGGLKRGFKHVRTTLKSFFHSKSYSKLSSSDSEESSSARSSYESAPKGFRLDHLSISLESLRRSLPPLLQRGSD